MNKEKEAVIKEFWEVVDFDDSFEDDAVGLEEFWEVVDFDDSFEDGE